MGRKVKPLKHKTLLIDADILIYRQACVSDQKIQWDEDTVSINVQPVEQAKDILDKTIERMVIDSKCTEYFLCTSHSLNFRYAVLPTYKHNRTKADPTLRKALKYHCRETHPALTLPECEADDTLGIFATQPDSVGFVIASIDKDLMQIPGVHYDWRTGTEDHVGPGEAETRFLTQWMTGDTTDGYYGIPGFGPAKAHYVQGLIDSIRCKTTERPALEKFRQRFLEVPPHQAIIELYEAYGIGYDECLQQARVAKILTAEYYDFRRRKVKLWEPTLS